MATRADTEFIDQCAAEFSKAQCGGAPWSARHLYTSAEFDGTRQVYLLGIGGAEFALKTDRLGHETDRLRAEFETLTTLWPHFEPSRRCAIVQPLYLSPRGSFLVTAFVDGKTVNRVLHDSPSPDQASRIYRRAGEWLHHMHAACPLTTTPFWSGWVFDVIDDKIRSGPPLAAPADYDPMIAQLRRDRKKVRGLHGAKAFSHGDYHGFNLILGRGETIGLDFTEAREKLAAYDICDFLKGDVFLPGTAGEIAPSGVIQRHQDMFFRVYRHPVDMDILGFCMRSRMLIDWLDITALKCERDPFQTTTFERLHERLQMTFALPL